MPVSIPTVLRKLSHQGVSVPLTVSQSDSDTEPSLPSVRIQRILPETAEGICTYQPPGTTDCVAASKYEAMPSAFTIGGPELIEYSWVIVSGDVVIVGDHTQKIVEISSTSDANVPFVLKAFATLIVLPNAQAAEDQRSLMHGHVDSNEPPAYIGGAPGSGLEAPDFEFFTLEVPIEPFDYAPYFSGDNLVFTMLGDSLPTGLTLSAAGILSGTVVAGADATTMHHVQVSNSKGTAQTNDFYINVVYVEIPQ